MALDREFTVVDNETGEVIESHDRFYTEDQILRANDEDLAKAHRQLNDQIDRLMQRRAWIEMTLKDRMRRDEAWELPAGDLIIVANRDLNWNYTKLAPLLEDLDTVDREKIYKPAHTETQEINVPEKWDTRTLATLARHRGGIIQQRVDDALTVGHGRLTVKAREGAGDPA